MFSAMCLIDKIILIMNDKISLYCQCHNDSYFSAQISEGIGSKVKVEVKHQGQCLRGVKRNGLGWGQNQ